MSAYGYAPYGGRSGGSPYTHSIVAQSPSRNISHHFEYIDPDDVMLKHSQRPPIVRQPSEYDNPEDPDVINVQYMTNIYPIHFAPYAINEEVATVRQLRQTVAKVLQTDPRKVRLVYKRRDLKHDSYSLKRYHLKQNSEVTAIKTEGSLDYSDRDSNSSSDSENENAPPQRRPRALSAVRYRSDEATPQMSQTPRSSATHLHPNGHIPASTSERSSRSSLRPEPDYQRRERSRSRVDVERANQRRDPSSSRTSSAALPTSSQPQKPVLFKVTDPTTTLGKLQTLANTFRSQWLPLCQDFISSPPSDPSTKVKDHRKLSESVMQHITLKADAIDVDSQEARTFRRTLINEVNDTMKKLDAVAAV